jgi:hypothetical protein
VYYVPAVLSNRNHSRDAAQGARWNAFLEVLAFSSLERFHLESVHNNQVRLSTYGAITAHKLLGFFVRLFVAIKSDVATFILG